MTLQDAGPERQRHSKFAVDLFNLAWTLLGNCEDGDDAH